MKKIASYTLILVVLLTIFYQSSQAQNRTSYTKTDFKISKSHTFNPKEVKAAYKPSIKSLEAPAPGGKSYRSHLLELKNEVRKKYPLRPGIDDKSSGSTFLPDPIYLDSFPLKYHNLLVIPNGDTLFDDVRYLQSPGAPLDNTLAVSNDDYLMCGINTKIYMHDLKTGNSPRNSNIYTIDFEDFASDGGLNTNSPFDPKILYDPIEDRFILTFLTGRQPNNSGLILAFSTSNNPTDPWHVYKLPGNPFDNGLWSDYPAIAITEEDLFFTINLLVPGNDWKKSFSETVIWHIDKSLGYNGDDLSPTVYGDISLDGRNLRNLAVVPGAEGPTGPNMYFLSNRNFDIENDTTFLVEVTNSLSSGQAEVKIRPLVALQKYGLPPNGRQANSDPNDPDDGFDTNDARVLGAFQNKNEIQFVGNSVNPSTGLAAIYHGFISDLGGKNEKLTANIIGDNILDYGYPNIVFTGTESCQHSSMIGFDHTAPNVFAGVSSISYSRDGLGKDLYSKRKTLKAGENYADKIAGSYERWGDYFGLQRKYNEPGLVYSAGFYGTPYTDTLGTWFGKLRDCNCFKVEVVEQPLSNYNLCKGQLVAEIENGIEPILYNWDNGDSEPSIEINLCDYTYEVEVSDLHGCISNKKGNKAQAIVPENNLVYPNPPVDQKVNIYFELAKKTNVSIYVYSSEGKLVQQILNEQTTESGKNLFTFSTSPLTTGIYIIKITDGDDEILTEKLFVP